jgi:thiamine-phosphate pyrophosphorylase
MTDDERLPDPLAAARALPRGSMVVVRARDAVKRERLSRDLLKVARKPGIAVVIAGDPLLAARLGADGAHLPEARMHEAAQWRARFPAMMFTAGAHSFHAAMRARLLPIDAIFLSPVFPTRSHPDGAALTATRANIIARAFNGPVYALGGVNACNATLLARDAFAGIAAIGALAV